jgi:hypothetical protein
MNKRRLTSPEQIRHRVTTTELMLEPLRVKIEHLRNMTAGDFSGVDASVVPQLDETIGPNLHGQDRLRGETVKTLVVDFEDGQSNKLLETVRHIAGTVAHKLPSIEAEDVDELERAMIASYLAARLGPKPRGCEALEEFRSALLDALICGVGWTWPALWKGKPAVQYCDVVDVGWDVLARSLRHVQFVYVTVRRPLRTWVALYGRAPFADLLRGDDLQEALDRAEPLVYYWDLDEPVATFAVLRHDAVASDSLGMVEHRETPYVSTLDGFPEPYLPLDPLYMLHLPQTTAPTSQVEEMLPHQLQLRTSERAMLANLDRGHPFYTAEEGALGVEAKRAFAEGRIGALVETVPGKTPPQPMPGMPLPQTLLAAMARADRNIVTSSGVNPYASGTTQDVDYAAEVNAIQSQAGVTARMIQEAYTSHVARAAQRVLWLGHAYDRMPLTLTIGDERLSFGPDQPLDLVLDPAATLRVVEDSGVYQTQAERVNKALQRLQTAVSAAAFAPSSPKIAYDDYLRVVGERNIARHYELPVMAGALAGQETTNE